MPIPDFAGIEEFRSKRLLPLLGDELVAELGNRDERTKAEAERSWLTAARVSLEDLRGTLRSGWWS